MDALPKYACTCCDAELQMSQTVFPPHAWGIHPSLAMCRPCMRTFVRESLWLTLLRWLAGQPTYFVAGE